MTEFDMEKSLVPVAKHLVEGNTEKAILATSAILTRFFTGSAIAAGVTEAALAKAMVLSSEAALKNEYAHLSVEEKQAQTRQNLKALVRDAEEGNFDRLEQKLGVVLRAVNCGVGLLSEQMDEHFDRLHAELAQKGGDHAALDKTGLIHNLPYPPNAEFAGRQTEIAALENLFKNTDSYTDEPVAISQPVTSVSGLGGMGKTQLALAYAYRNKDRYCGLLWVDAEGTSITDGIASLASKLNVDKPELPILQRAQLVKEALEQGGPWLLILDNVDDAHAYLPWLPAMGRTHVLITTRDASLPNVHSIQLDRLEAEDALTLLLGNKYAAMEQRDAALRLCDRFDYLTLAIATAGTLIKNGVYTPSELLAEVDRDGVIAWTELADANEVFKKHPSIARLFDTSLQLLNKHPEPDISRAMALVGGWFAPVVIEQRRLFDAVERLFDTELSTKQCKRALEALTHCGIARLNDDNNPVFHRMMGAFLRTVGDETENTSRFEQMSRLGNWLAKEYFRKSLYSHSHGVADVIRRQNPDRPPFWCLNRLVRIGVERGEYDEAESFGKSAMAIFKNSATLSENERKEYGRVLNGIGQIHDAREDFDDALNFFEKSLKINKEVGDRRGEGETLNLLGGIHRKKGAYDDALKLCEESLEIRKDIGDHQGEAAALNSIGVIYAARGKWDTALTYYDSALKIREDIGDKQGEGTTLNDIGQVHSTRGDYSVAIGYFNQALRIRQQIGDKKGEGSTLNNIGGIHHRLGLKEKAFGFYERSLRVNIETNEKALAAVASFNMAKILAGKGDLLGAIRLTQKNVLFDCDTNHSDLARDLGYLTKLVVKASDSRLDYFSVLEPRLYPKLYNVLISFGHTREAQKLKSGIGELGHIETWDDTSLSKTIGQAGSLHRLVNELTSRSSKLHKTVKTIKDGVALAQSIAHRYNDVAPNAGLPSVPESFIGRRRARGLLGRILEKG